MKNEITNTHLTNKRGLEKIMEEEQSLGLIIAHATIDIHLIEGLSKKQREDVRKLLGKVHGKVHEMMQNERSKVVEAKNKAFELANDISRIASFYSK